MANTTIRVTTDVGGTFTDLVCFETDMRTGQSRVITAKSDTTPPNFEQGVLDVLAKAGIAPSSIDSFVHGTTVVINALTERKGVKVGLITTEGFRDSLEIARGNRPDFFNLHYVKPAPFVPRHLRQEVPGRLNYQGEELSPLDLSGLPEILEVFRRHDVRAVAICLLHAYANPAHEQALHAEVERLWPGLSVVSSHQITREWREYERSSTTVLSAYVQPIAERYLTGLQTGLVDMGFSGSLHITQSNCGVDTLEAVSRVPITMVESGPSSGFWGAAELGKAIGEKNVLALDIGGTTAKCALIENGEVRIKTDYWIERDQVSAGYPIMVPVVDLVEIGNGGGSIAWVDDFGKLHVGPQSAGAMPGPAAYGRGGHNATTTDANLWLGRINRDYFCGGAIDADMQSAEIALRSVGDKLGVGPDEAARGIVRIANNNMVNALKLVSLNRGHDPRDFTMVVFGGGGAMHGVALAMELGVGKVVVPAGAAVFSAWGMMMSNLRRDYFVTRLVSLGQGAAQSIETVFAQAEHEASRQFAAEGIDPARLTFKRYGKFRYQNQEHTTEVLIEGTATETTLPSIVGHFHDIYEREYTYRLDVAIEMVGIHLVATAESARLTLAERGPTGRASSDALKGYRDVDYAPEGVARAAIYDGAKLEPGMSFSGPAVVEDSGTTIVIHPGNAVSVDGYGNLHILLQP